MEGATVEADDGHIEEICGLAVEQDGVEFRKETVEIQRIKEDAEYEGARVLLTATVSKAKLVVQIDIGFGDSIIPRPTEIEYPVLLEFPVPKLLAYPKETVVAEKLEAITVLGVLNSRMKDYFDLMLLSQLYEFDGAVLHRAVRATFKRRSTEVEPLPIGLSDDFALVPGNCTPASTRRSSSVHLNSMAFPAPWTALSRRHLATATRALQLVLLTSFFKLLARCGAESRVSEKRNPARLALDTS